MGDSFGLDPRKPGGGGSGYGLSPGTTPGSVLVWTGSAWVEKPSGDHVLLALLSDPTADASYFCNWFTGGFVALDSAKRTLSTPDYSLVAGYVATEAEVIDRLSVKFSSALAADFTISAWVKTNGGTEADTGVAISCLTGDTFSQNLVDTITLAAGDELKFSINGTLTIQHLNITGRRRAA
jgi:hypothetical protein